MAHKIKRLTSHRLFLPAVSLFLIILLGVSASYTYAQQTPAQGLATSVDFPVSVNGYPSNPTGKLTGVYLSMFGVTPVSKGNYQGTWLGTKLVQNESGVTFNVPAGSIVDFVAFKDYDSAKAWRSSRTFFSPPYRNFTSIDGVANRLCQINYLDTETKMQSNGGDSCATSISLPLDTTPAPSCKAGNSIGGDGDYSVCAGNTLTHRPSLLVATISSFDDSKVVLSISGMPGNNTTTLTVYKNSTGSVGGNNGLEVTYKYTGNSPTFGADISITSKATTTQPTSTTTPAPAPTTGPDKTLTVGEVWDLGNGMTVTAQSIDARAIPRQAWLTVKKGATKLDDAVVAVDQTYSYPDPSKGQPLVFKTKIYSIFSGATSDMVQFKETFIAPSSTPATGGTTGSQAQPAPTIPTPTTPTPATPVVIAISTSPASDSQRAVYVNPGKSVVLTHSVTPGYVASNWEWTTSNDIFSCAPEGSNFVCSTNSTGATSITASAYVNGVKYTSAITNLYSKALTQTSPTSTAVIYFSDSGALADASFITNNTPQEVLLVKMKAGNAPITIRSLTFKENSTIYPFLATLYEQNGVMGPSHFIASQTIDQYGMLKFNDLNILIPANTVKYLDLTLQGKSDGVTSGYQFYLELTDTFAVVESSPSTIGLNGIPVKGPLMTIKTVTTSVQSNVPTQARCVTLIKWHNEGTLTDNLKGNTSEAVACSTNYSDLWQSSVIYPSPQRAPVRPNTQSFEEEEGDDFSEEGATDAGITDVTNPKFGTSGGKNGFKFAVSMENNSGSQLPVILVSNSCSTSGGRISRQASKKYTLTGSGATKSLFIPLSGSKSLSRVNSAKKNKDEITCNFELLDVNDDSLSVVEVDIVWDGRKWVVSDTRNDSDE